MQIVESSAGRRQSSQTAELSRPGRTAPHSTERRYRCGAVYPARQPREGERACIPRTFLPQLPWANGAAPLPLNLVPWSALRREP